MVMWEVTTEMINLSSSKIPRDHAPRSLKAHLACMLLRDYVCIHGLNFTIKQVGESLLLSFCFPVHVIVHIKSLHFVWSIFELHESYSCT